MVSQPKWGDDRPSAWHKISATAIQKNIFGGAAPPSLEDFWLSALRMSGGRIDGIQSNPTCPATPIPEPSPPLFHLVDLKGETT